MDTDELTHFYVEFEWQVVAAAWQILLRLYMYSYGSKSNLGAKGYHETPIVTVQRVLEAPRC